VTGEPPPLVGVLETSLYHDAAEAQAVQRFYTDALALPLVSRWPGGFALRIGPGAVLLLFERETVATRDGPIADHGSRGPGHACLLAPGREAYERWRERLGESGTEITHEQEWDAGRRSFYFKDPAGNLLEIADGDIWPSAR
jgi:catechol 2,3-dioxygenase-like lactoylglutathione lyase family enzyme